jgi:UDP:flavonoid glycosyltransferase YjiC (YdhE family)
MKVTLMAAGSRGDIQPFACLGGALVERGHEVELVAPRDGEPMARAAGLSFRAIPTDVREMFGSATARRMLARGRASSFFRWVRKEEGAYAAEMRRVLLAASEEADLIVCGLFLDARCQAIASTRGIEAVPLHLAPLHPSRSYVSPLLPQHRFGPLTRVSHDLALHLLYRSQRDDLRALHRELGIPPPSWSMWRREWRGDRPALLGYSQVLFPRPPDWAVGVRPVGCLRPTSELRARLGASGVPADLDEWLQVGPRPVFFGFGSMPVLTGTMLPTIRAALAELGMRGILATGWSEVDAGSDETLFVVDDVDHQSLLPRCAAAVHHGGAGTTAASAAAGIPTVVCSVVADQAFWGARCRALGIGDTLPFRKLNTRRLVASLRDLLRPDVAARAKQVARRMTDEDGVARAVAVIEAMDLGCRSAASLAPPRADRKEPANAKGVEAHG